MLYDEAASAACSQPNGLLLMTIQIRFFHAVFKQFGIFYVLPVYVPLCLKQSGVMSLSSCVVCVHVLYKSCAFQYFLALSFLRIALFTCRIVSGDHFRHSPRLTITFLTLFAYENIYPEMVSNEFFDNLFIINQRIRF